MKKILLVISLISVLLLTGCNKNENVEKSNLDENNAVQQQEIVNNTENTEVPLANISVEDSVSYTDAYYHLFKVKLPRVVGNTNAIKELNQRILNEVLPITYCDVVMHSEIREALDKGSTYDYKYIIKDDVLVINIYSSVPNGGSTAPTSGGGLQNFSYFYDISNDRILTLSEAASKLSLSLDGLTTLDEGTPIDSYDELEANHYDIIINNDDLEFHFFN